MAMAKLVCFLLLALLGISMAATQVMAEEEARNQLDSGPGSLKFYQCPSQCSRTCSYRAPYKLCMYHCRQCCAKCLSVPPGFSGNEAVCPCYSNGQKCPRINPFA